MKDSLNTIFLDFNATFFPERNRIIPDSDTASLVEWNFIDYICNSNADQVAISLFNKLNKEQVFNIVLIDTWIDESIHLQRKIKELLNINGLDLQFHENWLLPYNKKETHSPLIAATAWMKQNPRENYSIILNEEYKNTLEFTTESIIDYNHSIFISKNNGISLENINDIKKSLNLWWN